jgi:hypothetical protein
MSVLDDSNNVLLTLTNFGYRLYTLNMLKSLKPYNIDKKVIVACMDTRSNDLFKRLGYLTMYLNEDIFGKFVPWNEAGYDKICYYKLKIIYNVLKLKRNVLYIDGDIVFLKNPLIDLQKWISDDKYDIWIQNDGSKNDDIKNLCCGFFYIKNTKELIDLYDCESEEVKNNYSLGALDNNDQTYFNNFIKPVSRVCALPLTEYPNGNVFNDNPENCKENAVLVHFNWNKGHVKMAKMKQNKMWLLTREEEITAV